MLKKTNIVTVLLVVVGVALSLSHFVMGYGLGNHLYVGMGGFFCITLGFGVHCLYDDPARKTDR